MENRTEKQKYIQTVVNCLIKASRDIRDNIMFAALMGIEPHQIYLIDLVKMVIQMKHCSVLELLRLRPEWRDDMMVALLVRVINNRNRPLLKTVVDGLPLDAVVPSLVKAVNILYDDIAVRYGWLDKERPSDYLNRMQAKRNGELSELALGIKYALSSSNAEWKKRRQEIFDKLDGKIMADLAAYELSAER
jgi:hypothetical protein